MEENDDLTHLLAQAADPPVATPDSFREVLVRHRSGRTRALLAALVAVALLGPAAGIAVGRATADRSTQVATGSAPQATGSGDANGSGGSGGSASTSESGSVGPLGSVAPFPLGPPPQRLFVRTTADGVTMRVYRQDNLPGPVESGCATDQGAVPCPTLPPECSSPSTHLQAGLSDDGAVDPGFVPVNSSVPPSPLVVLQSSYFGVLEGDSAAWVAVKAGEGVARVRVRFADGATDDMVPVDGYGVLAHRIAAPALPTQTGPAASPEDALAQMKAFMPHGTAEALDAAGAVLSTADLTSVDGPFSPHCAIEVKPPSAPPGEAVPARAAPVTTAMAPATTATTRP